MLGTNCNHNDIFSLSQVASYDIVYAHGVPENHLEHLCPVELPTRCLMSDEKILCPDEKILIFSSKQQILILNFRYPLCTDATIVMYY